MAAFARAVLPWGLVLLALLVGGPGRPACLLARGEDLHRAARELRARYAAQLEDLARWCDQQGLADQAAKTRKWLGPRDPNKLYVVDLPQTIGRPPLPEGTPAEVAEWDSRFHQLRRQHAESLEALSRRAVRSGQASLALDLVLAAIRENPDHEPIRRLLGFQRFRGGWYTLYEIDKLRAGYLWDEKFGWIPKSHSARYAQGLRPYGNRWISAEEDAQLHRQIGNPWQIETEHYTIRTNHSIEAAVALGVKLERLYRVWKQLFVRYFASEAQLIELFDPRSRVRRFPLPRLGIVYFRDRADYIRALKPSFPNIELSIGIYVEATHQAYFFAGEEYDERTLYHEATHQLFHEARPVFPLVGQKGNFWIIEGIAMYMESLRQEEGFNVLGGFDDPRMVAARYRLLHEGFYIPLAEFTAYTVQKMQTDPRIAALYSQAAGLTHFLIHYEGGVYRDALVGYLDAVYAGRDTPQTLARLTGKSLQQLDAEYRKFIAAGGPVRVQGKPLPVGPKP
ncbi:MAG: hypothetical protein ACUVUC_07445 [Thermoguttaceae bacterium]